MDWRRPHPAVVSCPLQEVSKQRLRRLFVKDSIKGFLMECEARLTPFKTLRPLKYVSSRVQGAKERRILWALGSAEGGLIQ